MSNNARSRILVVIAIVAAGIGFFKWRAAPTARDETGRAGPKTGDAREVRRKAEERPAGGSRARPAAADPALNDVRSPLARRYLSFLVAKGGRLAEESHGGSIVNGAFAQAWMLTSRMELTAEQQDRLAGFLLEEDWLRWDSMPAAKADDWAGENLNAGQREILRDFLAEQKEGAAIMEEFKREIRLLEHGDRPEQEVFAAEMAALKNLFSPEGDAADARPAAPPTDAPAPEDHAGYVRAEQALRFYNLLADRIPLTVEQHQSVYAALRSGAEAPINPYPYQTLDPERAEAAVSADTAWLGALLTKAQYENYLRHFLAEIEMIRFQNRP
jgi:hypothetical protein